jgi:hypothetical protein
MKLLVNQAWLVVAAEAVVAFAGTATAHAESEAVAPYGPACPAAVSTVSAMNGDSAGATLYAVEFETYTTKPAFVSGTVTLFAGDDRYDIAVQYALAMPLADSKHHRALFVRFPSPVKVTGGYLSAISGDIMKACPPERLARIEAPKPDEAKAIVARQTVDAPPPIAEAHFACDVPFASARTTKLEPMVIPSEIVFAGTGDDGNVLLLRISAKGALMGMTVARQSRFGSFDHAAEVVAKTSTFAPAIFHCEPVEGYYALVTMYNFRQ